MNLYDKALAFATKAHEGQTRKLSGLPYIVHPIEVAKLVAERTDDEQLIAAALLHDTVEDCDVTFEQLEAEFDTDIALYVSELTNIYSAKRFPDKNRAERKTLEALRLGTISDGAKLVKACDIASNTKDVDQLDEDFATTYMAEKLEVLKHIGYDVSVTTWAKT